MSSSFSERSARHVVVHALAAQCDFYRRHFSKYSAHDAHAPWDTLPFLCREDIQHTPFFSRLFIPKEELDAIRTTSGTSGKGIVPMPRTMWRATDGLAHLYEDMYAYLSVTRNLSYSAGQYLYSLRFREDLGVDVMNVDQGEDSLYIALVETYRPDMLAGFAYALLHSASLLSEKARARVRAVQVFGERCLPAEWTALQKLFPHAALISEYSSIESQTIVAMPCRYLAAHNEQAVHPVPEYVHCEIINTYGVPCTKEGEQGEIVITTLQPLGLPLIRYRTGDCARIVSLTCPCGTQTPVLSIEGRIEPERIRIHGGEINIAAVQYALARALQSETVPEYCVEVEGERDGAHKTRIYLCVSELTQWSREMLATFSNELYVAPGRTYTSLVHEGTATEVCLRTLKPLMGKKRTLVRI